MVYAELNVAGVLSCTYHIRSISSEPRHICSEIIMGYDLLTSFPGMLHFLDILVYEVF